MKNHFNKVNSDIPYLLKSDGINYVIDPQKDFPKDLLLDEVEPGGGYE